MIATADKIVICFAHFAYWLHERFSALEAGINSFAVRDLETLENRVGEADVLVISGLWRNQHLDRTKRLRFIQSIGAGTDQFPREELPKRGIRLASARGVNARAVAAAASADKASSVGAHRRMGMARRRRKIFLRCRSSPRHTDPSL
ncbi:MAG: hypothetical protein ACREE9_01680 [Stellaceae bacterium]